MENQLPIHVFNMDDERNIDRIVSGERVGTLVTRHERLIDELLADARERMAKSVEATRTSSARCAPAAPARRCSTASSSTTTARRRRCKQLATISAPEARLLTVQPYDKSSIKAIEKAILESDLGLTPNNDGQIDPPADPRADRGAPQASWSRSCAGSPRRAASRSATSAATSCTTCASCKEAGEVGADDEHRAEDAAAEAHRRSRSASSTRSLKAKEAEILEV